MKRLHPSIILAAVGLVLLGVATALYGRSLLVVLFVFTGAAVLSAALVVAVVWKRPS